MYYFKKKINAKEHDQFIENHPLNNLLQSSSWAKVKDHWESEIVGVYDQKELIASSLVLIKKLPFKLCMMYIPRGPIMDYENERLVKFYFQELKKWAKQYHCLFIKIDPCIHRSDFLISEDHKPYKTSLQIMEHLKKAGLQHQGFTTYIEESIQPRFQANVYKPEDFDASLPRHTKRLIKDALKRDVKVVKATKERLQEFSDVVSLTEERKQVSLRNHEYFKQLMDIYGENAYLFLAEVDIPQTLVRLQKEQKENAEALANLNEGSPKKKRRLMDIKHALEKDIKEFTAFADEYDSSTVIAGILSIKFADTMEMLYAGMNDQFKKFMPQYYLYTENMKYAFEHGCNYANMGGIEGDFKDGLTKFKANFNPHINEFIGEFDVVVNRPLYKLSQIAYKQRKNSIKNR